MLYTAAYCFMLLYTAIYCCILLYATIYWSILVYTVIYCCVLLCTAVCYSIQLYLLFTAVFCCILQYTAVYCYILLTLCCSTLNHTLSGMMIVSRYDQSTPCYGRLHNARAVLDRKLLLSKTVCSWTGHSSVCSCGVPRTVWIVKAYRCSRIWPDTFLCTCGQNNLERSEEVPVSGVLVQGSVQSDVSTWFILVPPNNPVGV